MATDHAKRQLNANLKNNTHWNYPDRKKKESPITAEVLRLGKEDYFKRTGIKL